MSHQFVYCVDGYAGQYFVTGDLTPDIFDDDCRFKDPTNDIRGLSRYLKALTILFDPKYSGVQLLSIEVVDDLTIRASWILGDEMRCLHSRLTFLITCLLHTPALPPLLNDS